MTTIKEIAEMAGVSMTTVYNVLHGNVKKVSKANMEKIQALLDEYHYVPKMGLSALKNNSSKIIGVVIHTSRYYENTVISDTFYRFGRNFSYVISLECRRIDCDYI